MWSMAVALGAAVAFVSWYWRYAWLPPGVWEDMAVAAGLRPPDAQFPLLWHAAARMVFGLLGVDAGIAALRVAGHVSLGLIAMLAFAVFNETMPFVMRGRMQGAAWCRRIVRVVLAQGAVLLVCSDPVWEAGQVFGPTMFHLLALLTALLVFMRYAINRGMVAGWYWSMALFGVMAGDTVLGVFLVVSGLVAFYAMAKGKVDKWINPLADPFVRTVTMRRMTLCALGGWVASVAVNAAWFCTADGLEAHALEGFQYAVAYLANYWKALAAAAAPSGWMLFAVVAVVPLVLSIAYVNAATDEDKFLPYWYAAYFLLVGVMAYLQLSGWRSFWFWTWTGEAEAVRSPLLKCCATLLNAQTFTYALSVLGVEIYFRNYRRIAGIKFQDSVEETVRGADLADSLRHFNQISRMAFLLEPILALALVVPYRAQATVRGIVGAVYDCARQTAAESSGAKFLFTDGTMDAAVELCAAERGETLFPLSLAGGSSERECYLRRRGAQDEEDREMLSYSAMDTLRTWLRFKDRRMDDVAVQLGFELWAMGKQPLPPMAGMVARPSGFASGVAEDGVKAARVLAERILDVYGNDENLSNASVALRDLFTRMQWRVARMCRMRADRLDREGRKEDAMRENDLADILDAKNMAFKRVRQRLEVVGQGSTRLTPREGLRLGMDRGDFRMAEVFARQVLFSDPDDLTANFAMGMSHLVNEQYGWAEVYLKKCLERKPRSASILNNLAVAQLRQGLLDEAEANARRAVEADGKSAEARRTLDGVLKARKERAAKAAH